MPLRASIYRTKQKKQQRTNAYLRDDSDSQYVEQEDLIVEACRRHKVPILFIAIILIAIFLRFFMFTAVPGGVNQDEADAGYQAFALLHHGTDMWGNKWPAYFVSWGSGQNVLESYMDIPIVAIFGLTTFAIRIVPATLGVLTVGLLFVVVRKAIDTRTALIASFLLAIFPWAVISSRWGLESNTLPFFLLLGVGSFIYSYDSKYRKYLVPFSLIPFALVLYVYVLTVAVVPFLILAMFILYYKKIWSHKLSFSLSVVMFAIVAFPIGIFLLENLFLHRVPHVFSHLPFSAPLLLVSRQAQNLAQDNGSLYWTNIHFLTGGFVDFLPWSNLNNYSPTALTYLPLVVVGGIYLLFSKSKNAKIFVYWFLASFTIFFATPLNDDRSLVFVIPLVVLTAAAITSLGAEIRDHRKKNVIGITLAVITIAYCSVFFSEYFLHFNKYFGQYYNAGLGTMLQKEKSFAHPNEDIFVSNTVNLNYVYLLYYLRIDSVDFQKHSVVAEGGGSFIVQNYRNYYLQPASPPLLKTPSYVYLLVNGEQLPTCPDMVQLYSSPQWVIGRCYNN